MAHATTGVSSRGGNIAIYVESGNLTVSETIDSNRDGMTGGGNIDPETGVSKFSSDLLFDSGSANVKSNGKQLLKDFPESVEARRVLEQRRNAG